MSAAVSHAIKHRKTAKDVFYTPEAVVKNQISLIESKPGDKWFDPFYGKGVYYKNFPTDNKDFTEIAMGKDFFDYCVPADQQNIDIICSNPPYSILDKVFERTVQFQPRVISYLLLHGAMTPKRMQFFTDAGYGLSSIYTTKVYAWYGMAEAYTFTRGHDWSNCKIRFDRIVHRLEDDKPKIETAAAPVS